MVPRRRRPAWSSWWSCAYDWSGIGSVADVGGGNGAFLAGLLARNKTMRGVLADLPGVVAGAAETFRKAEVADRCETIDCNFFEAVPGGADAYVLKRILYGWKDEQAALILRTVRRAMRSESRLLVIEPIVDMPGNADMSSRYDLLMLAMMGSRARTREEIDKLFSEAGLKLTNVIPTLIFPIVEGRPV